MCGLCASAGTHRCQQLLRRRTALLWMLKFLSHKSSCAALPACQDVSSYFCCFAAMLLCSLLVGDGAYLAWRSERGVASQRNVPRSDAPALMQHLALHIRTSRACRDQQLELSTSMHLLFHRPRHARFEAWRDLAPAHLTHWLFHGFPKDGRGTDEKLKTCFIFQNSFQKAKQDETAVRSRGGSDGRRRRPPGPPTLLPGLSLPWWQRFIRQYPPARLRPSRIFCCR